MNVEPMLTSFMSQGTIIQKHSVEEHAPKLRAKVPANGLTPACRYSLDVSSCILSLKRGQENE